MGDSRNFGTRKPQHPNERENFGGGRGRREDFQYEGSFNQGHWDDRRGGFRGGRFPNFQWRQRAPGRGGFHQQNVDPQFDLRNNLNHGRDRERDYRFQDELRRKGDEKLQDTTHSETKENEDAELKETSGKKRKFHE